MQGSIIKLLFRFRVYLGFRARQDGGSGNLSYRNTETILFTFEPFYGNLNKII